MRRDRSAPTDVGGYLNSHSAHAAGLWDTATHVTDQRANEFAVYHIKRNLERNRIRNFRVWVKNRLPCLPAHDYPHSGEESCESRRDSATKPGLRATSYPRSTESRRTNP